MDDLRPAKRDAMTKDYTSMAGLSPVERELLIEYQKLASSLNQLSQSISRLTTKPTPEILATLQSLESKTSLVFTLLKASVYSVFVQNEGTLDADTSMGEAEGDPMVVAESSQFY